MRPGSGLMVPEQQQQEKEEEEVEEEEEKEEQRGCGKLSPSDVRL